MMRKNFKKTHGLGMLVLLFVFLLALPLQAGAAKASITLNASKKSITVGNEVTLKATVTGKSSQVTWKSSKKSVATVSSSGVVTAKKAGKTTITAKANGKTAKCVVTVKKMTWKQAYKKLLSASKLEWVDNLYVTTSKCKCALIYVNNDKIPELLVATTGAESVHAVGFYKLYTFANGKVKSVTNIPDYFRYYKKTGILVTGGTWGSTRYAYCKLDASGKLTTKLKKTSAYSSGTGKYSNTYGDASGKTISKSAFQKALKKLVGSKKETEPTFWNNTTANRNKYLS